MSTPVALMLTYLLAWGATFGVVGGYHLWRKRTDRAHQVSGPLLTTVFALTAAAIGLLLL